MIDALIAARRRGSGSAWHQVVGARWTACDLWAVAMTERVPLSQVPESDRCRTCWPTTKETR